MEKSGADLYRIDQSEKLIFFDQALLSLSVAQRRAKAFFRYRFLII